MRSRMNKKEIAEPLIKVRSILLGLLFLAASISIPLFLVWKQVSINKTSRSIEKKVDSLAVLQRQIATLKLSCEDLSSTARIEKLAKSNLSLDYPQSKNICVIEIDSQENNLPKRIIQFFAGMYNNMVHERKS